MPRIRIYPSSAAIAEAFVQVLRDGTANRLPAARPFLVALSGGTTPKAAYELLSMSEIDASKIELYMVDERFVPPSDDRSNEAMIRRALGDKDFAFFPMFSEGTPEEAALRYHRLLRDRVDKFDLVLLGMGDDGHTASIFPRMWPELPDGQWCVASEAPVVCKDRITLTPRAICWAKQVVFMVSGESKSERVRQVLQGEDVGNLLPAQYVSRHAIDCEWWLDEAAAARLESPAPQE